MSAVETLEHREDAKFDEKAFVDFLESVDGRSGWGEGGRWELIGGIPIDMPPATIRHGLIAQNLERLLASALGHRRDDLEVQREAGVRHPEDDFFRPIADLIVYQKAELSGRDDDLFFDACLLVAEVLSPRTRHHDLVFKRRRYAELPACRHILFVEQEHIHARHWMRADADAEWTETVYRSPMDPIELSEFGFVCKLRDLYARTDLVSKDRS